MSAAGNPRPRPRPRPRRWSHTRIRREYSRFVAGARGPLTEVEYIRAFGPYQQPTDGEVDELLARETERMAGAR